MKRHPNNFTRKSVWVQFAGDEIRPLWWTMPAGELLLGPQSEFVCNVADLRKNSCNRRRHAWRTTLAPAAADRLPP